MVDYREEVRIGPHILERIVEAYRKIRNTLRILAGNLHDFDPAADAVPVDELVDVDRYALARYGRSRRGCCARTSATSCRRWCTP